MFEYMGVKLLKISNVWVDYGRKYYGCYGEIIMALLEVDVNYQDEVFIKIVKDELVSLLGEDYVPLEVNKKPTVLMLTSL